MKVPETVGVPLIVTTLVFQLPVTPVGNPVTVAPVAMVLVYVMLRSAVLIQRDLLSLPTPELSDNVLVGTTVIVPVAVFGEAEHPPVRVTV
jgi:hypothetical protein